MYARLPPEPQRKEPDIDLYPDTQEDGSKSGFSNYLDEFLSAIKVRIFKSRTSPSFLPYYLWWIMKVPCTLETSLYPPLPLRQRQGGELTRVFSF